MTAVQGVVLLLSGTAGAWLGKRARLPMWPLTGAIIGGLVVSAVMPQMLGVPQGWRVAAQILVGTAVGSGIQRGVLSEFRAILAPGLLAVITIISVGAAGGILVSTTGHVDPVSGVLGMVPGGVGEMVASAAALDGDVPLVAGMHVLRLVISLAALPLLVRTVTALAGPPDPPDPS
jgi:membrane AbrB-like protein